MGRARERKRKSQKKEDTSVRNVRTVAKHGVFPMICGSGGSKSRLAKAAGAEPSGRMRNTKLHAAVARSTFSSQNAQAHQLRTTFWKLGCRKNRTPLWREAHFQHNMCNAHHSWSIFGSSCRKMVRRCGAKHIFKSKC